MLYLGIGPVFCHRVARNDSVSGPTDLRSYKTRIAAMNEHFEQLRLSACHILRRGFSWTHICDFQRTNSKSAGRHELMRRGGVQACRDLWKSPGAMASQANTIHDCSHELGMRPVGTTAHPSWRDSADKFAIGATTSRHCYCERVELACEFDSGATAEPIGTNGCQLKRDVGALIVEA